MDPLEISRRLKAARALAGFGSTGELAEAIDTKGLGDKTLRKMEAPGDSRVPRPHELRAIADVTGLPYEFFTESFDRMRRPATAGGAAMVDQATRLAELGERTERGEELSPEETREFGLLLTLSLWDLYKQIAAEPDRASEAPADRPAVPPLPAGLRRGGRAPSPSEQSPGGPSTREEAPGSKRGSSRQDSA